MAEWLPSQQESFLIINNLISRKKGKEEKHEYERNGKVIRFALSHGYDMGEILQCMKQIGCEDEYMD